MRESTRDQRGANRTKATQTNTAGSRTGNSGTIPSHRLGVIGFGLRSLKARNNYATLMPGTARPAGAFRNVVGARFLPVDREAVLDEKVNPIGSELLLGGTRFPFNATALISFVGIARPKTETVQPPRRPRRSALDSPACHARFNRASMRAMRFTVFAFLCASLPSEVALASDFAPAPQRFRQRSPGDSPKPTVCQAARCN